MIRKAPFEPQISAWLSGISSRATSRSRNPHVPFGNQPRNKLLHSMSKHMLMCEVSVLAAPWSSCHSLNYSLWVGCTVKASEPLQGDTFCLHLASYYSSGFHSAENFSCSEAVRQLPSGQFIHQDLLKCICCSTRSRSIPFLNIQPTQELSSDTGDWAEIF